MTDKLRCVISDPVIKKAESKMKGWGTVQAINNMYSELREERSD